MQYLAIELPDASRFNNILYCSHQCRLSVAMQALYMYILSRSVQ